MVSNQIKSVLAWLLLLATPLQAAEQIITPDPVSQQAGQSEAVSFDAIYTTADPVDETLPGLGLRMHWDSSQLAFDNLDSNPLVPGLQPIGAPQADIGDLDGAAATDIYLLVAWIDLGGNWPGAGSTPLRLFTANFTTNPGFSGGTSINFSTSSTAAGYVLAATSPSVQQPLNVPVPPVAGLAQAAAETAILAAGLDVGSITSQASATVTLGNVISQDPAAGTSVPPNTDVDLIVSSGPAVTDISVPDLSGMGLSEATAAIVDAGFVPGTVTSVPTSAAPSGTVIGQDPAAGSRQPAGSAIDLSVAVEAVVPLLPASALGLLSLLVGAMGLRALRRRRNEGAT